MTAGIQTVGRIKREISVQGQPCWALFDTGAVNSFVTNEVAARGNISRVEQPHVVRMAGIVHRLELASYLNCSVEGRPVELSAYVLPNIGSDEDGRRIDMIFGALEMQRGRIRPVPDEERLDMTH